MSTAGLIEQLRGIRTRFDPASRVRRWRLLTAAGKARVTRAAELVELHELLLFACCYPDDRAVLKAAEAALKHLAVAAGKLLRVDPDGRAAAAMDDSGIAGTASVVSLSFCTIARLVKLFPRDLEIDWDEDGSAGEGLDEVLQQVTATSERDGLLRTDISTREWFDLARGRGAAGATRATTMSNRSLSVAARKLWRHTATNAPSAASILLDRIALVAGRREACEQLFEAADVSLRWNLGGAAAASRSFLRFPARPVFYQAEPPARGVDVPAVLTAPLPRARVLPRSEARSLIDLALTTLAVRHRETDPVTYANDREITLFHLERGIDVLLLGMRPDARLPIESFFGYVAARNRVPIGYGGGWVFSDRCEIGVNIFDTFRGGESALIFANILRVYHQHYGAKRFLVDPFQFGAGNDEAIASGAFWFYHRLGFRPIDERLAGVAEVEAGRLRADPAYRTPPRTLKRLAGAKLQLALGEAGGRPDDTPDVTRLGTAVTAMIGRRFRGNMVRAELWAMDLIEKHCADGPEMFWERGQLGMYLLAALIDDLPKWPQAERRALWQILRGKCGTRERTYARAVQKHDRFLAALRKIAASSG
jgi:hypothetical protein